MSAQRASKSRRRSRREDLAWIGALAMLFPMLSFPASASPAGGTQATLASPAGATATGVECPVVGAGGVAPVKSDWKDGDFPLDADDITTADKIDAIIRRVRNDQPGVSFPSLVNALNGAYCPIVAREADRTDAQKRAQLARFDKILEQQIAALQASVHDQILAEVPLSSTTMQAVASAAASAHETPQQWMADVVAKAAMVK